MQLIIQHKLKEPLKLPIHYHHIVQSAIFNKLESNKEYSSFIHNKGYRTSSRTFKLFTFGALQGKYVIEEQNIIFLNEVMLEIRSIDARMIQILSENIKKSGITYLNQNCIDVHVTLMDKEIEEEELTVRMLSPICVYSTDIETGKTYFYHPSDMEFSKRVNENFKRKYFAYSGVEADSDIQITVKKLHPKDKYVTKYKGFYINGWKGEYVLQGKRKYLDFLYQTGLGSKNSQGFGMFKII